MIASLLQDSCIPVSLERNSGDFEGERSVFETVREDSHHHAFLNFHQLGSDFATIKRKQTRMLQQEGIVTLYVSLPTHVNQSNILDRVLTENGYFFSGLQPNSDGNWSLYYTNLLMQKFNSDALQLFSPKAVALSQYMKALYAQMI